jgi:hypothetical protein
MITAPKLVIYFGVWHSDIATGAIITRDRLAGDEIVEPPPLVLLPRTTSQVPVAVFDLLGMQKSISVDESLNLQEIAKGCSLLNGKTRSALLTLRTKNINFLVSNIKVSA